MTWRWLFLKAKGSIPAGLAELPEGRSRLAPGCELAHDGVVPPVAARERVLWCKGVLAGSPSRSTPFSAGQQSGLSDCLDLQH